MTNKEPFDLIEYLAIHSKNGVDEEGQDRIPSLTDLSKEMGISIASLREQLGVARALGLVEVRPKTGIRRMPYRFAPAVIESLSFAISSDRKKFDDFADLRKHIEADYWTESIEKLIDEDKIELEKIVERAWTKLRGEPIRVPHQEHRDLHIMIFSRLDNPFVTGILEAYWEAYEIVGLGRYNDLTYLNDVWNYHQKMVNEICAGDIEKSFQTMLAHMELIDHRNNI